ncbi:MAG: hypothetical protein WCJ30_15495, partial [Deltaproteobacteria bacterium]
MIPTEVVSPNVPRTQIGIDENGLGPRLGPMIVTAVRLELDPESVPTRRAFLSAATRAGIGDSKAQSGHGAMAPTEARVLAIMARHLGLAAPTFETFARHVGLDDELSIRTDCPDGDAPVACFGHAVDLPAFGAGPTPEDHDAADKLHARGIRLAGVRVAVVCAKRMNVARAAGISRFELDLASMVRLAAWLRGEPDSAPVIAYCGKVGGRARYASALEKLSPLVGILGETRERSSYAIPRFGEVHFVMDGDASADRRRKRVPLGPDQEHSCGSTSRTGMFRLLRHMCDPHNATMA